MATNIKRSQSLAVSFERRTMCRQDIRIMASGEPSWPTPMKAIGAQNLLTMPGGVTISGYLHKKGGKQFQLLKWPLRFVIIHKGCVYYFKTSTSATSQGAFSLNGYNRVMRAAEETSSSNVFPFKMVHISKKQRTWYFSAASEEERKKWMLSLRKEIDRYHEKKETVTDLSDPDSDSDSFYGSVERPVDINYIHNPSDDSYQDEDDDDDEDDYEKPDGADENAPAYPPPPVPRNHRNGNDSVKPRAMSDVGLPYKPPPPTPPLVKTLPNMSDLDRKFPRRESASHQGYSCGPPAHKIEEFTPKLPLPKKTTFDFTEKEPRLREDVIGSSDFVPSYDLCGPNIKLPSPSLQLVARNVDPPALPPASYPKKKPSTQLIGNTVNKELADKFRILPASPPVPAPKLSVVSPVPAPKPSFVSPVPPPKPSFVSPAIKPSWSSNAPPPPLPPVKPSIQQCIPSSVTVASPTPPVPPIKPRILGEQKAEKIPQKPPPIPRQTGRRPESDKLDLSPKLSPPDGQSFRGFSTEVPAHPPKPRRKCNRNDSDEDYEQVPLPISVFIDTNDSVEVERIFKAASPGGTPENGLFCIRNSAKAGKVLVVWDKVIEKSRNYRIFEKETEYFLEANLLFPDVESLVEHYYTNTLPSHSSLVLQHAYGCSFPR
ncbi:SH3 domain-binding protein 2 isoform X2 [Xenopus tropicalis]|uniref:SH3 domain-binding protein 2 n=1 Tax=Xenopus tropicalis TaxID=8364 RepID=A0A8J0QVX5_XENTR|nr:SH3 domain-binding protein 2 isoform X2 [Xenopus tropicalis]|eukprot:XP_004911322.1 PREDICTED: SH3 domain-binding protein 2 isoform X2 [Xenopus tropicalis]